MSYQDFHNDGPDEDTPVVGQSEPQAPLHHAVHLFGGMTLRDYFAAAALQGILAANDCPSSNEGVASWAYIMADAMLAERNKKND